MENVGLFPEFQNYKMAATSCFIFSFSLRSKRFRLVSGAERDFRFFFVLGYTSFFPPLFWLVHGFCFGDSRLPSYKCYQRGRFTLGQWCPVSHPASPGWSWFFTVVYSLLDSLLRVSQNLLNSFLYLGKLHWFPSLGQSYFYEPSVFTFRYVGDRISWKTWCWNENDGGWDVISCLLLSCVLYCMEGEFEQIITKQGQQQLTAE